MVIKNKKPPTRGPTTVPTRKLDSILANLTVLFSFVVISAKYANDAGLVAEPSKPFINLPKINAGNNNVKFKIFFSAKNNGVIRAIKETAYPIKPRIAIFLRPYLSLALPQKALVKAHAIADIAKIDDV